MGQSASTSMDVRVEVTPVNKRDYIGPILYTIMNCVVIGFAVGILFFDYDKLWSYYFAGFHFVNCLRGLHMFVHILSWYIIYAFFYLYLVEPVIKGLADHLVQLRYGNQIIYMFQFFYGMFMANEILGGWMDLQKSTNCLVTKDCKGFFIERFMQMIEMSCEYFGAYDYHERLQIYTRDPNNFCERLFHFMPSVLTSLFSCGIAFVCLILAAPNY